MTWQQPGISGRYLGWCIFSLLLAVLVHCQTDTLIGGSALYSGQYLTSADGYYKLVYESNGIITGFSVSDGKTFWQSNGPLSSRKAGIFALQTDCNLVAYDNSNKYYWATMTNPCSANVPYKLQILNTRNVVLFDSIGTIIWHSNTAVTIFPSRQPSPSVVPTKPSNVPTVSPTYTPTVVPSKSPTFSSKIPSSLPSNSISNAPSKILVSVTPTLPTNIPTTTTLPSSFPTIAPTRAPTIQPIIIPSSLLTISPTDSPIPFPTFFSTSIEPSNFPSSLPTEIPSTTILTVQPIADTSLIPSSAPSTDIPSTDLPIFQPSVSASLSPTQSTIRPVTMYPTSPAVSTVSEAPTFQLTTFEPSNLSEEPSSLPFLVPTLDTSSPTIEPSLVSTEPPSAEILYASPTMFSTLQPTYLLSELPTAVNSVLPTVSPTIEPLIPTALPSSEPSFPPSLSSTDLPSELATGVPSLFPTSIPSIEPSQVPIYPSSEPSSPPSVAPTAFPVFLPTGKPFDFPTIGPSLEPSSIPTTFIPTNSLPSQLPTPLSSAPTAVFTFSPTDTPSDFPTSVPYVLPTLDPTIQPSLDRTGHPSSNPSSSPSLIKLSSTDRPSDLPAAGHFPSCHGTCNPQTYSPSEVPTDKPLLSLAESPSLSPSVKTPLISKQSTLTPSIANFPVPYSLPNGGSPTIAVRPSVSPRIRPSSTPKGPSYSPQVSPTSLPSRPLSPKSCPSVGTTLFPSKQVTSSSPTVNLISIPTFHPSSEPQFLSNTPTTTPSLQSINFLSEIPMMQPSYLPSPQPSTPPTTTSSFHPSCEPQFPSIAITTAPSLQSIDISSEVPTLDPSYLPSSRPSTQPITLPTQNPSTSSPTILPMHIPTTMSTSSPSFESTAYPSSSSTGSPSMFPTLGPHAVPSSVPSTAPIDTSLVPSVPLWLTQSPSQVPTAISSHLSSESPSSFYPTTTQKAHFPTSPSTEVPVIVNSIMLYSHDNLNGFNTKQRLLLKARVLTSTECLTNWTVSDSSISLSSLSLIPMQQYILKNKISTVRLYLPGSVFSPGKTLLFSFHCGLLFASLTVTTNMPPTGGTFNVNPSIGYELSTSFFFSASLWFDSDLPMQYLFGYSDPSSTKQLSINAASTAQTAASYLPSGRSASKFFLNTTLIVSDSLASSSKMYFAAVVKPSSFADIRINASNKLSLNMINVFGSFLNQANCTGVSNCSKLNRLDCSNVDFTCGNCVSGYIGEPGSHNSLCWSSSKRPETKYSTICRTDSDCGAFEICQRKSGTCVLPSKECVNSCSFKGNCSFVSRNYRFPVIECKVSSSDCDAVCSCDAGYAGSSCSFTSEELHSRISTRHNMLQGIDAIIRGGNISAGFVVSMGSTLSSVTEKVDELSSDSVNVTLSIMESLLNSAADSGVGYFDLHDLLSAGDFAAGASTKGTHSSQIVRTVNLFNFIVAQQILPSQDSVVNILSNFRTITSIISTGKGSISNISIPQSPIENLVSTYRGGVVLAQNASSSAPFTVSLAETSADLFHSFRPIISNALTIHVSNVQALSQSNSSSNSTSYDVLINLKYTPFPDFSLDANFTTHCTHQMSKARVIQKYVCKLGSTLLIHNCTNKVGTHTSYCPVYRPSCQSLPIAGGNIGTVCRTVNYTAEYIFCLCTVSPPLKISRRSLSSTDAVEAVTLQVATMSELVANTFKDTFDSADELNSPHNVQRVLIVILMFSSVWLVGVGLTLACNWRRNKMKARNMEVIDLLDVERNEAEKSNGVRDVRSYLVEYILEVFPSVFRERSRVQQVIQEIRRHHKYFSLFLSSETGDRADTLRIVKVARLLTIQTMLMFLLAVFYGLQSPSDDGTCHGLATEKSCLARKTMLDTSQTYCEWILVADNRLSSQNGYICGYRDPIFTAQMVLIIAVLVSLITVIFLWPIEYLFKLLAAPTADSKKAAAVFVELQRTATTAARRASAVALTAANTILRNTAPTLQSKRLIVGEKTILFPNSTERAQMLAHASIKTITVRATVTMVRSQEREAVSAKSQLVRKPNAVSSALAPDNSLEWDEKSSSNDGNDLEEAGVQAPQDLQSRLATAVHQQSMTSSAPLSMTELMDQLTEDVTLQRKLLPCSEIEEYDRQWGLDPTGDFTRGDRSRGRDCIHCCGSAKPSKGVQEAILQEMEVVKKLSSDKVEQLKIATDEHTGLEILHLFVLDLLGRDTPAAIIFEQKADEDFKRTIIVTEYTKYVTVAILLGLNVFFAYYSVLYGYKQGVGWQQSYLFACIAQMFVEIFINETLEVMWLNCFLPTLVTEEVCAVSSSLIERVSELCEDSRTGDRTAKRRLLNVPDYLFVSTSVAKAYPKLLESIIVQTYTTHLPGELAKKWNIGYMRILQSYLQRVNRQRSGVRFVSLSTVLAVGLSGIKYLATAPVLLQRMLMRSAQPFFVSGVVMAFYAIIDSPVNLAAFLACFAVAIGFGVFVYMRDSARRSKMLVQPIVTRNEAEERNEVAREQENIVHEDLVLEENADVNSFRARSESWYSSVSPPISESGEDGDDSGSSYCFLSSSRGQTSQSGELLDLDNVHVRDRFHSEGSDIYEIDSIDLGHVSEP